jgi:hypothetical protein
LPYLFLRPAHSAVGVVVGCFRMDWAVRGYTQIWPQCPPGEDPNKIAEVVLYHDAACFAHRVHTPLRLAFGLFDWTGPAEGIFSGLNTLPLDTPCELRVDPYGGHTAMDYGGFYQGLGLLDYQALRQTPPARRPAH